MPKLVYWTRHAWALETGESLAYKREQLHHSGTWLITLRYSRIQRNLAPPYQWELSRHLSTCCFFALQRIFERFRVALQRTRLPVKMRATPKAAKRNGSESTSAKILGDGHWQ